MFKVMGVVILLYDCVVSPRKRNITTSNSNNILFMFSCCGRSIILIGKGHEFNNVYVCAFLNIYLTSHRGDIKILFPRCFYLFSFLHILFLKHFLLFCFFICFLINYFHFLFVLFAFVGFTKF